MKILRVLCLFVESDFNPVFLKVLVYFTELVAVAFVCKTQCQMHKSTRSHPFFHGKRINLTRVVAAVEC